MNDYDKTKDQLIEELRALRQRLADCETDTGQRISAGDTLRRSEAFYRSLVENSPEVIYSLSPDDGTFTSLNPAFEKITGWSRAEWLGQSFVPLIHPDDVPKALEMFQRTIHGETPPPFELRIHAKSGEYLVGEIIVPETQRVEDGKIVGAFGFARDITMRKRVEEAFQQEAAIAAALARIGRAMISSLDTPVILTRLCQLTTEVLECDYSQTLLWKPEEQVYLSVSVYGATTEEWETLRVLTIPRQAMSALLDRLQHEEVVEVVPSGEDGLTKALSIRFGVTNGLYIALRRGSEIIGIQTAGYHGRITAFTPRQHRIAQGIAQLASMALENARLLEQAERANKLKSDFLATMSHELRTPLNIIMGYTDLLLEGELGNLPTEQVDVLKRVDRSARALLDLITATLDVGRLETGQLPLEIKEISLAALLGEVAAETRELCHQAGLRFSYQVALDIPPLTTDPAKLKVVLKNLVSNAIKFTEVGSVTVEAHTHEEGVEICVTDTGIGIEPAALSVIFESFRQLENPLTRHRNGIGLGLYIVRRMLELLGGHITVDSTVGRGSTFRVWVPLTSAEGSRAKLSQ